MTNLPFIDVSGMPTERGLAYGESARDRIAKGLQLYVEQIERDGLTQEKRDTLTKQLLPLINGFDADYVSEMEGIAKGANVALSDIVLLNARTEILQLAKREGSNNIGLPEDGVDGCTGVIVHPKRSENGKLLHAQNWDWKAECADTAVVLRIQGQDGSPDILTFAEAGQLARTGFNSAGIAVSANYLESDRDYKRLGVPLALLRRKILQVHQFSESLKTAYCTKKSASNNLMISHMAGIGIDIECAPDESFIIQPQDGLLVHANHWQSEVALTKLKDTGIQSTPDSLYRDLRVRELLEIDGTSISKETVKSALFDDFQTPEAVCRPPMRGSSGNLSATVATIIMCPEDGTMDVALLPANNTEFSSFSISSA